MSAPSHAPAHVVLELQVDDEGDPLLSRQEEDEAGPPVLSPGEDAADAIPASIQDDMIEAMQQDDPERFASLLGAAGASSPSSSAPYFLAFACCWDDGAYVSRALGAGIDPNVVIKGGVMTETYHRLRDHGVVAVGMSSDHHRRDRRAIHVAAGSGNVAVLTALLQHPDTEAEQTDSHGDTWLHYLARRPYANPAREKEPGDFCLDLLQTEKCKKIVNVQNKAKNSFLHVCASSSQFELMETALRSDILLPDVGLRNVQGDTALHLLARASPGGEGVSWSQTSCVKLLAKKGVDVNAGNKKSSTALHVAAESGNYPVMRVLLSDREADIGAQDEDRYTAFHRLALNNRMADDHMLWCARMFYKLDDLDVNAEGASGKTPLHLCALSGNFVLFKELARHTHIELSKKDSIQRTVVHYMSRAREGKDPEKIRTHLKFVLGKGIDVNARDKHGQTALHVAVMENFSEMTYLLLENGANILERNLRGKSVVDIIQPHVLETYMNRCISSSAMPHENNFKIMYNYRFLLSDVNNPSGSSDNVESSVTFALGTNRYLHHLLCHPLITSFLHLKWRKWRFILFTHVSLYALFVALLNICVILSTMAASTNLDGNGYNDTSLNYTTGITRTSLAISGMYFVLPIVTIIFIGKILVLLILFQAKYNMTVTSLLESFVCASSVYLTVCFLADMPVNMHMSLCTVVVTWSQLILLTGSLPIFSVNLEMLKGVLKTFVKYFSWYFIIIVGFALSFFVLFYSNHQSNDHGPFFNPWSSFVQTMWMMAGQGDPTGLSTKRIPIVSDLMLLLFLIIIVVVLLNLLSGLAIGDTGAIRAQAQLLSQKSMVRFVYESEAMLRDGKKLALVSKLKQITSVADKFKKEHAFTLEPNKSDSVNPCFSAALMKTLKGKMDIRKTLCPLKLDSSIIEATIEVLQKNNVSEKHIIDSEIVALYNSLLEKKLVKQKLNK